MPADLQPLIDKVHNTEGIVDSATTFILGEHARLQAAVDQALANGATAEQLVPVTDEVEVLKTKSDALAEALAANGG